MNLIGRFFLVGSAIPSTEVVFATMENRNDESGDYHDCHKGRGT